MSRPFFANLTITRLRYPSTTDQGVEIRDYSATPEELPITRCWYEPTSSTVDRDGRTAVRTGYLVDGPGDADVIESDHVRINGTEYELDGEPLDIPSPTGALSSTRFTCLRWEG